MLPSVIGGPAGCLGFPLNNFSTRSRAVFSIVLYSGDIGFLSDNHELSNGLA